MRQNDLRSWNLTQAAFFTELNIVSDIKKVFAAGKIFADLADDIGRIPSFDEFKTAFYAQN